MMTRRVPCDSWRTIRCWSRLRWIRWGFLNTVSDLLAAELPSRLGSLKRDCERLAAEHVNIENAYGSAAKGDSGLAVLKVNDLAKARRVLDGAASDGRQRTKPMRRKPARA
jgi:hypothetical protein